MPQPRIKAEQIDIDWLPSVATTADLAKITGPRDGVMCLVRDIDMVFEWDGPTATWILPKATVSRNVDGGSATSVFSTAQKTDGGKA